MTVRFEHAIPAIMWLQIYALERMATGISTFLLLADRNGTSFRNVLLNQNQTIKTGRYIHVSTVTLFAFKGCQTWSLKQHVLRMYNKVLSAMFLPKRDKEVGQ